MKRVCALFFCCSLSMCVRAQSQRTGVARSNFHSYSNTQFDGNIPTHFNGADLRLILAVYGKLNLEEKDEFESAAAFRSRVAQAGATPILGEITSETDLAFVFPGPDQAQYGSPLDVKYDAERERLNIDFHNEPASPAIDRGTQWRRLRVAAGRVVAWTSSSRTNGEYTGTNAFGASTTVKQETLTTYGLLFSEGYDIEASISIPPEQARQLKENVRVLLLCRIKSPVPLHAGDYHKPTLASPIELAADYIYLEVTFEKAVFFDWRTGQIIAEPK